MQVQTSSQQTITPWRLFAEFCRIGLSGFGGVLPFVHYGIVVRNKWLNEEEFLSLLSSCQFLPGPNILNFAVMFGWRTAGWRGALAAPLGLTLLPMLLLLCIAYAYQQVHNLPVVQGAIRGMLAVSSGLIMASAFKLAKGLPKHWVMGAIAILTFISITFLHLPLFWVLMIMIPSALLFSAHLIRKEKKDALSEKTETEQTASVKTSHQKDVQP